MINSGKQNISNSFTARAGLLGMARITQVSITFFIFWLYAVELDKNWYGIYQKVFVIAGLSSSLLSLGLPVLIGSLPVSMARSLTSAIFKNNLKIYLLAFGALVIFIMASLPFLPLATRILLVFLSVINAVYTVVEMTVIKLGKDTRVFFSNMLYSFLFFAIHLGVLYRTPFSISLLVLLLSLLSLLRLGWLFFRNVFRVTSTEQAGVDILRVYHRQWIYLSLNETLENFSKHIDKIFLLWLLSASAFAIYFNGAYEIPLLSILVSVSGTFLTVQAKQQEMDNAGILSLFYKSSLLLSIVLFPLFFFLQLNAHVIFDVLFRGKYNASVPVFLISSWIIPLRIANYTAILQTKLKSELIFRGSIIGLAVKIIACILFYSFWNANGVAMAVVVGTLVQISFYLVHSADALQVKPADILPFNKLAFCFVTCAIISVLVKWAVMTLDTTSQIISGMLCMIVLATGFYFVRKYASGPVETGSTK